MPPVQPLLAADLEPDVAYPYLAALRAALNASDWPAALTLYDGLPDDDARVGAIWLAADEAALQSLLAKAARAATASTVGRTYFVRRAEVILIGDGRRPVRPRILASGPVIPAPVRQPSCPGPAPRSSVLS